MNKELNSNKSEPAVECLSLDLITQYLDEALSPETMQQVESHLQSCELCSEALEGLKMMDDRGEIKSVVENINNKISLKTGRSDRKVINFPYVRVMAVAASIIILLGSYFLLNDYFYNDMETVFADSFEDYPNKISNEDADEISPSEAENLQEPSIKDETKVDAVIPFDNKEKITSVISADKQIEKDLSEAEISRDDKLGAVTSGGQEASVVVEPAEELTAYEVSDEDVSQEYAVAGKAEKESEFTSVSSETTTLEESKAEKTSYLSNRARSKKDIAKPKRYAKSKSLQTPSTGDALLRKENMASKLDEAMRQYDAGDHEAAITLFEDILIQEPDNLTVRFYAAISYLNLDKAGQAITYLDRILRDNTNEYYEAAKWYTTLAYIKLKDESSAKILLNEIIETDGDYKERAVEILDAFE